LQRYPLRVLACDWGGGGEDGTSFTALSLLGLTSDGKIHCLWGKRMLGSQEHFREAMECLHWLKLFRCQVFVHDYTGAGTVRETVMVQAGFDLQRVMPISLIRASSGSFMRHVPATPLHNRDHYRLDKTRSLLYTFQAIKHGLLQFFRYDYVSDNDRGLMSDFLALIEEKVPSRLAGDIYTIIRNPMLTDDFAQATNIGCAAIWHISNAWPRFAEPGKVKITAEQEKLFGSQEFGWESDEAVSQYHRFV